MIYLYKDNYFDFNETPWQIFTVMEDDLFYTFITDRTDPYDKSARYYKISFASASRPTVTVNNKYIYVSSVDTGTQAYTINQGGVGNSSFIRMANSFSSEHLIAYKNRLVATGHCVNYLKYYASLFTGTSYRLKGSFSEASSRVKIADEDQPYNASTTPQGYVIFNNNAVATMRNGSVRIHLSETNPTPNKTFETADPATKCPFVAQGYIVQYRNGKEYVVSRVISEYILELTEAWEDGDASTTSENVLKIKKSGAFKDNIAAGDEIGVAVNYCFHGDIKISTPGTGYKEYDLLHVSNAGDEDELDRPMALMVKEVDADTGAVISFDITDYGGFINEPAPGVYETTTKEEGEGFEVTIEGSNIKDTDGLPSKWYPINSAPDNSIVSLTMNYAEGDTPQGGVDFVIKKETRNGIYISAEGATTDWNEPGFAGGELSSVLFAEKNITGIANYNNALIIFTEDKGFYILGNDVGVFTAPESMRLPIGALTFNGIEVKENFLAYFSTQGIYATQSGQLNIAALEALPLSRHIQKTWLEYDITKRDRFFMKAYRGLLLCVAPLKPKVEVTEEGETIITDQGSDVIVLDTETHVDNNGQTIVGWTRFKNFPATSFNEINGKIYYGSLLDNGIYEFDVGGVLSVTERVLNPETGEEELHEVELDLHSSFLTKRWGDEIPGEKQLKSLSISANGNGVVYITPIIDGIAYDGEEGRPNRILSYEFDTQGNTQEIIFPRENNPFNYMCYNWQYKIELRGKNENILIYPPKTGVLIKTQKEQGRRQDGRFNAGGL